MADPIVKAAIKAYFIAYAITSIVIIIIPNAFMPVHAPGGFLLVACAAAFWCSREQVVQQQRSFNRQELKRILLLTLPIHIAIKSVYFLNLFNTGNYPNQDAAMVGFFTFFNISLTLEIIGQLLIMTKLCDRMAQNQ